MAMTRKITVEVRADLLRKAQEASGSGITETVRAGLELMAASRAYAHLLRLGERFAFRVRRRISRPIDDRIRHQHMDRVP
jgi:hypothetical protein